MIKWVHYLSLKKSARRALSLGNGKHGKFHVDGDYIAIDVNGRAGDWIKVIRSSTGSPIVEKKGGS